MNTLRKRFDERGEGLTWSNRGVRGTVHRSPEKELQFARIERFVPHQREVLHPCSNGRSSTASPVRGSCPTTASWTRPPQGLTPIAPVHGTIFLSYLVVGFILCLLIVLVRYILHDNITSLNNIAKLSNVHRHPGHVAQVQRRDTSPNCWWTRTRSR